MSRLKPAPSMAPISTCAALVSHTGTPERTTPQAVRTAVVARGPSIQPAFSPARVSSKAAPRPSANSSTKPGSQKGVAVASRGRSPRRPAIAIRLGTATTIQTTRSNCATATGAARPP